METEGRTRGISLWLTPPEGHVRELLTRHMESFAAACGGPRFPPHVTLLGELAGAPDATLAAAGRVARAVGRVEIALVSASGDDRYFRAVALEAGSTESLLAARRFARRTFGLQGMDVYAPHLALAYGRVPAGTRASLVRGAEEVLPLRFSAASLEVVKTEGTPREWRRLAVIALAG